MHKTQLTLSARDASMLTPRSTGARWGPLPKLLWTSRADRVS